MMIAIGLLGTHVFDRPDNLPNLSQAQRQVVCRLGCLCDTKINDLGDWFTIVDAHNDVTRLQVPVNDPFLMSVLNAATDVDKETETIGDA